MSSLHSPTVQTRDCPKCGHTCEIGLEECPRCQVIIDKVLAAERGREQTETASFGEASPMDMLASTGELAIRQHVERIELFTNIERANRYTVMDSSGNVLFDAYEESGTLAKFLSRMFLKAARPFKIHVTTPQGRPVFTLDRPFRFYFHELRVQGAVGNLLGTVRKRFSVLNRKYEVTARNAPGAYELFGPLFRPWTFKIMRNSQECGVISKRWGGLAKEIFTDADRFGIAFPRGIDVDLKAVFLGAVFLIDFVHFEDNNRD